MLDDVYPGGATGEDTQESRRPLSQSVQVVTSTVRTLSTVSWLRSWQAVERLKTQGGGNGTRQEYV